MRKKTAKYWVFVLTFPIFFTLMLCVTRLIITAAKEWTPIIIYDLWTHNPYVVILLYTMMYLVLIGMEYGNQERVKNERKQHQKCC